MSEKPTPTDQECIKTVGDMEARLIEIQQYCETLQMQLHEERKKVEELRHRLETLKQLSRP